MRTIQGIDTPYYISASGKAAQLKSAGIDIVAGYIFEGESFKQAMTKASAQAFSRHGIATFCIWESGTPETAQYYQGRSGHADGAVAAQRAIAVGAPRGSYLVAVAADYDAPEADFGAILGYMTGFHQAVREAGLLLGGYGSGAVLQMLLGAGVISRTMLSGSTGWTGYDAFKDRADILQGPNNVTVAAISCDRFQCGEAGWTV